MWDLIVSVPAHCLSFYFVQRIPGSKEHTVLSKKSQQTHKVSTGHVVPGWSGSVPVQLIFFNSYILNSF